MQDRSEPYGRENSTAVHEGWRQRISTAALAGPPAGTKSYLLVVEDPDAPKGTFHHWIAYNIAPEQTSLPEGVGAAAGSTIRMVRNDFGNPRYDGPQPPPGHGVHHYHFRLAALDVPRLDLSDRSSLEDVWDAAQEHVIEEAEIVGTFER